VLTQLQKAAAFLLMIGLEKSRKVLNLMDSDEIKTISAEFAKLTELSPHIQERVRYDFVQLGYEPEMNPAETLYVLRQLFNGSKIRKVP
jgi:flagellar motor switch protein FliG